jgi:hypothetical protein
LLRQSANANLLWQFGIKPAIDDIKKTLSAHESVSLRLQSLRQNAGTYVPVRVQKTLSSSISNSPLAQPSLVAAPDFQWQCLSKESKAVLGCQGRVREDINLGSEWSAYLQYFGINKVVGLAWELIPGSFILDWFTNAQERINSLTRLRTGGPFTEFRNFSASEKQVMVEGLYLIPGYSSTWGAPMQVPDGPMLVAKRATTTYSRYLKIPDVSGVVDLSTLGLFHLITSSSLILQRLLR